LTLNSPFFFFPKKRRWILHTAFSFFFHPISPEFFRILFAILFLRTHKNFVYFLFDLSSIYEIAKAFVTMLFFFFSFTEYSGL